MDTKKVLLIINNEAFTRSILRWYEILRKQIEWEPIIFSTVGNHLVRESSKMGLSVTAISPPDAIGWLIPAEQNASHQTIAGMSKGNRIKNFLSSSTIKICYNFLRRFFGSYVLWVVRPIRKMMVLRRQLIFVRGLIRREKISVMMICESSPAYDAPVYIRAARRDSIPVVVAPIERWSQLAYADAYKTDLSLSLNRSINSIIAKIYPRWVTAYKGLQMIRIQPEAVLAQEWLGIGSLQPWQMVGAWNEPVVVANEVTSDFYTKEGVKEEQLRVVGSPEHDIMADIIQNIDRLRSALYKELGFPNGQPLLLCALVQDHFLSGYPEAEFHNYHEIVDNFMRPLLTTSGFNVVISLHPSHKPEEWQYLERSDLKISSRDIAKLIPMCDFLVAAGSSTIPFAIACGKPVVNYDVYRHSKNNPIFSYSDTAGVITVSHFNDYNDAIRRLTSDHAFLCDIRKRSLSDTQRWGRLDGNAGNRLTQLFEDLVDRRFGVQANAG